jgi:hypothetical protein
MNAPPAGTFWSWTRLRAHAMKTLCRVLPRLLRLVACRVMSSQSPAPKGPDGVSGGPVVFVLAALTIALFLIWYWFPVSVAVAPSSARSAKDVEAVAALRRHNE